MLLDLYMCVCVCMCGMTGADAGFYLRTNKEKTAQDVPFFGLCPPVLWGRREEGV